MIKAKKVEIEKKAWFEWDDELSFEIRYLTKKDMSKIRKKATTVTIKRIGQKTEEINDDVFAREYLNKAITGWKGMKYKHLIEICEPIEIEEAPEVEIKYDDESKAFIIENHNLEFLNFVMQAVNTILKIDLEQREVLEKNS